MDIDSDDYHDYVFRDGKLVGQFEQMYKKAKNVPWHQDQIVTEFDVKLVKLLVQLRAPYSTILDVGCGLGYFANELAELGSQVYGIDVSPTAIQRLTEAFPLAQARAFDITVDRQTDRLFPDTSVFELVVCRALFWYVFPSISQVVRNVSSWVGLRGYLLIHQNFPPLASNFVGKEVIPSPDHLLRYFMDTNCFELLYANTFHDHGKGKGNDNWSTFFLQRIGAIPL